MFVINHDRMAIDQSDITYLPPNNWSNLGDAVPEYYNRGHYIYYQEGDDSQRIAEIINDPININNKAMHFKINEAYHMGSNGYGYGRVQSDLSLIDNPMKEYTSSIRLFLPHNIGSIAANGYNMPHWLTLMEIWMNPTWRNKLYPFRISLSLKKSSNQPLHFQVDGTYMNHLNTPTCVGNYASNCFQGWFGKWNSSFPTFSIPTGQWMTLRVYIKDGNLNTGKFKLTVTPDGEDPVTIFDITNWTHHEYNTNSLGIEWANPFKLYVSKNIIDYINLNNRSTNIYWDVFILCDKEGVDLQIRDTEEDLGVKPNTASQYLWASNDIWVRSLNDGGTEHQNPMYNPLQPSYINVRVNNKSCQASKAGAKVHLYWAKAGTALTWPESWDGTLLNQGVTMGNYIGAIDIPPLAAGKDIVLTRSFPVPNPELYQGITVEPWHFCLLARIEYDEDPMSYPEDGLSVVDNTRNNNNIAWKNISIVPIITDVDGPVGASVSVRNPENQTKKYDIQLLADKNEEGNLIFDEAEVILTIDEQLLQTWTNGDKILTNLKETNYPNKFIVTGDNAKLGGLKMEPYDMGMLNLSFNFLTKKVSNKSKFTYHVIQKDADNSKNKILGGETYIITRDPKALFYADAGGDKEIRKNQVTTISAGQINNLITYNWYDMEGNLIYVGKDLTVTADVTKKYKLEVIDIDGYKDYDVVEVKVNPFKIEILTPNPATNLVTINYKTQDAISAYLMLVNINSGIAYNYILNTSINQTNLDISSYGNGLYKVVFICDGEIVDTKTLIKN